MTPVQFLAAAQSEIDEATDYYLEAAPAEADRLTAEIDRAIGFISENPYLGSGGRRRVRRYVLPHFPYSIIYSVLEDHILVVALAPHRRRPGYWLKRLK